MGRIQQYQVRLTEEERKILALTTKGKISPREMKRIQDILMSDLKIMEKV